MESQRVSMSNLIELTEESPIAEQPKNTNISLRPHQLALLRQCQKLEEGEVDVDVSHIPSNVLTSSSTTNIKCRIRTRVGIIADKVGSGKSNVILSLIASDLETASTDFTYTSTYTYGLNNIIMFIDQQKQLSNVNVLVIPHNLVSQWTIYIKDFFKSSIKTLFVSKSKHLAELTPQNLTDYNLIVVTSTFYVKVVQVFQRSQIQVRRTIYDEVDSINITTNEFIDSAFHWFVTASYMNLLHPKGHGRYDRSINRYVVIAEGMRTGGFVKLLFNSLYGTYGTNMTRPITNLVIAKNNDAFVDQSIMLPPIEFHYIKCRTPRAINILDGIVDRHIIQCLNSGDVDAAIHFINPSHRSTEENIINILLEKYTKSLHNINTMLTYVSSHMQYDTEQQRQHEVDRLHKKREEFENKIKSITNRIKENDMCSICFDTMSNKTIVNCCMNSFCFSCISKWVSQRHTCPLCKETTDMEKLYIVQEDAGATDSGSSSEKIEKVIDPSKPHESFDKMQNLETVIRQINESNPDNKVLIFSMNEGIFEKIQDILTNMQRKFKMLKGTNVSIAKNVESYKSGDLNTLLVNPENYGSGLNLENTTDMIMLHKFDNEIEKQVIGRAQRYGRSPPSYHGVAGSSRK